MINFRKLGFIFLILITALGLCACSSDKNNKAMGRYVEEEITLPTQVTDNDEYVLSMIMNPKGELELYTSTLLNAVHRYILGTDGAWTENTPPWDFGEYISIMSTFRYGDNGKLYIADGTFADGVFHNYALVFKLYELREDGTKTEIPVDGWDVADDSGVCPVISNFEVMENGDILAQEFNSDRGLLYDATGKKLLEFENGSNNAVCSAGAEIISLNENGDKIIFIDKQTGFTKNEFTIARSDLDLSIAICSEGNDNVYIANRSGIFYIDMNGSVSQTLVDGNNTSLDLSYLNITSITKAEEDSFYVLLRDESSFTSQVLHYTYCSNVPTVPDKELTIYSLEENEIIKEAIVAFERIHPEIHIDYRVAKVNGKDLPTEDYIRILNSEILAGDGADIIVCDGLPEMDYINKGLFEDISDVIDPLVDSDQIYGNIVDFYRQDGKLYTLPMKLELCVYTGKEAAVVAASQSLSELKKYYENNQEIPLFGEKLSYKQLFQWFYGVRYKELMDDQGLPDSAKLITFLEQVKNFNTFNSKNKENEDWFTEQCFLDKAQDKSQLAITNISNIRTFLFARYVSAGSDNNMISAGAFLPDTVVGINKQSDVKDFAKEFLKILLTEEVQERDRGLGIPMNANAIKQWYEKQYAWNTDVGLVDEETGYRIMTSYPPGKEQVESLVKIIDSVSVAVRYDSTVYNIIVNEIDPFFQGERTAEEVTAAIMEKIATYKKE